MKRIQIPQLALILLVSSAASVASAWAGKPTNLRPEWAKATVTGNGAVSENSSFLANIGRQAQSSEAAFLNGIFNDRSSSRIRQQYNALVRDYEMRKHYELNGLAEERAHFEQLAQFSRKIFNETRNEHVRAGARKFRKASENNDTLNSVRKPVEVVAGIAAISTGTPVDLDVAEATQVRAVTHVTDQRASLLVRSPFLNSSIDYEGRDQELAPGQIQIDPTQVREKYKVSLSRGLPVWDLNSGVSFGATTQTFTASVSKQLTETLRCVVDSSRQMSDARGAQGALKLFYDIRF